MFRKHSLITFGTRIISFLLQIMRSIVAARALGPYGRGVLSIIYTSVQVVFMVLESGITLANVYHIGNKKYSDSEVFTNSFFTSFLIGSLGAVGFIFWYQRDPLTFGMFAPRYMMIAASMIPLALFTQYNASLFQGKRMLGIFNIIKITEPLVFFIAFILLVEVSRMEVAGAIYANVIGHLAATLVSVWAILRLKGVALRFNRKVFPASLKFGLKGHIGSLGGYLNSRFDIFLVNYYTDMEYVGFYTISVVVAESILYIPNSMAQVLFPIVAAGTRDDLHGFTATICRNVFFISLLCCVFLFVVSDHLVVLAFGEEFREAVTSLKILLPGVFFLSGVRILNSHLIGMGHPTIPSIISWIMFLVNVPVNILLIPKYGIAGAALASTFSYGLGVAASLGMMVELSKLGWSEFLFIKRSDIAFYSSYIVTIWRKISFAGKN